VYRTCADLAHGLPDRRQRRREVAGRRQIVEADDGHVLRHTDAQLPAGRHRPQRHLVAETEDRGRWGRAVQQRKRRRVARLQGKVTRCDAQTAHPTARLGDSPHTLHPLLMQRVIGRPTNHGDPLVPQLIQMIHDGARSGGIVDMHTGNTHGRVELAPIHHRRSVPELLHDLARRRRQPVPQHDQPVSLVAPEHLRVALLAFGQMLGVAQQHRIAHRLCRVLCALQDLGEERVGDVRHGDQYLAAALGLEVPGDRVGHVTERGNCLLDSGARRRQHLVRA